MWRAVERRQAAAAAAGSRRAQSPAPPQETSALERALQVVRLLQLEQGLQQGGEALLAPSVLGDPQVASHLRTMCEHVRG